MYNNDWDQRIPNEPILARNFILKNPPIIPNERPYSTYCSGAKPIGMLNLHNRVNNKTEQEMESFWNYNIINLTEHGGLPLKADVKVKDVKVKDVKVKDDNSPWMQSVHYNIIAESTVKPYRPYNTRDCIKNRKIFTMNNDIELQLNNSSVSFNRIKKLWDINTSSKLSQYDHRN